MLRLLCLFGFLATLSADLEDRRLSITGVRNCHLPYRLSCKKLEISQFRKSSHSEAKTIESFGRTTKCACLPWEYVDRRECPGGSTWTCSYVRETYAYLPTPGYALVPKLVPATMRCFCVVPFRPVVRTTPAPLPEPTTTTPAPLTTPPPKQDFEEDEDFVLVNGTSVYTSDTFGVRYHNLQITVKDQICSSGFGVYPLCLRYVGTHTQFGESSCPPALLDCETAAILATYSTQRARAWFNSSSPCIYGTMRRNARGYQQNCKDITKTCQNSMDTASNSLHPTSDTLATLCFDFSPPKIVERVVATIVNNTIIPGTIKNVDTLHILQEAFEMPLLLSSGRVSDIPIAAALPVSAIKNLVVSDDPPSIKLIKQKYLPNPLAALLAQVQHTELPQLHRLLQPKGIFEVLDATKDLIPSQWRTILEEKTVPLPRTEATSFGFIGGMCAYRHNGVGYWCNIVPPSYLQLLTKVRLSKLKGQQGVPGCTSATIPSRTGYGRGTARQFASHDSYNFTVLGTQNTVLPNCTKQPVTKFIEPGSTQPPTATTTSSLLESFCTPARSQWFVVGELLNGPIESYEPGRLTNPPTLTTVHLVEKSYGGRTPILTDAHLAQQISSCKNPCLIKFTITSGRPYYTFKLGSGFIAWVLPKSPLVVYRTDGGCYSPSAVYGTGGKSLGCSKFIYVFKDAFWNINKLPAKSQPTACAVSKLYQQAGPTFSYAVVRVEQCYNTSKLMEGVCANQTAALLQFQQILITLYPSLANHSSTVATINSILDKLKTQTAATNAANKLSLELLTNITKVFQKATDAISWEIDSPTSTHAEDGFLAEPDYLYYLFALTALGFGCCLAISCLLSLPGFVAYSRSKQD